MTEGPSLHEIMHHVSSIPSVFFISPMDSIYGGSNRMEINIPAIISDLIFDMGGDIPSPQSLSFFLKHPKNTNLNFLRITAICCYIFTYDWFILNGISTSKVLLFLRDNKLIDLAEIVDYNEFIQDMERREEIVRFCLDGIDLFPKGENKIIAKDRLTTLDSIERKRIIEKSRKAQERSRQLREAMARKRAQEAASKMTRE